MPPAPIHWVWTSLLSRANRISLVRWIWVLVVLWCELGIFYYSTAICTWPEPAHRSGARSRRILIVADPQVLNHDSYPGRNPWLMSLSQYIVDLNLRKSWRAAKATRPDAVIFLGDMMDNGRDDLSPNEYNAYLHRFYNIFSPISTAPIYYLPGNHDVGIGATADKKKMARLRYMSNFGPLNQHVSLANHSLVLIDAPILVEEDRVRKQQGQEGNQWLPKELKEAKFINSLNSGGNLPRKPLILFSHIPLSRPEGASCGPLREKGWIRAGRGAGYENTLSQATTNMLLETFRPSLVFSGDDHDYCEYTHRLRIEDDSPITPTEVREVSVKSFSMAMGIARPGFHLLSLSSSGPPYSQKDDFAYAPLSTFADRPCFLPNQLSIYVWMYLPLFLFTLCVIVHHSATYSPSSGFMAPSRRHAHAEQYELSDVDVEDHGLPVPGSASKPSSFSALQRRGTRGPWVLPRFLICGQQQRPKGFVGRFGSDFLGAAWPPVGLYVLISLIVFW